MQDELSLKEPNEALVWLIAFKAKARAKKWTDSETQNEITDNFMATCGLESLKTVMAIVEPKEIATMKFSEISVAIEDYLRPKSKTPNC